MSRFPFGIPNSGYLVAFSDEDEEGPIAEHRRWARQFYVDAASR